MQQKDTTDLDIAELARALDAAADREKATAIKRAATFVRVGSVAGSDVATAVARAADHYEAIAAIYRYAAKRMTTAEEEHDDGCE